MLQRYYTIFHVQSSRTHRRAQAWVLALASQNCPELVRLCGLPCRLHWRPLKHQYTVARSCIVDSKLALIAVMALAISTRAVQHSVLPQTKALLAKVLCVTAHGVALDAMHVPRRKRLAKCQQFCCMQLAHHRPNRDHTIRKSWRVCRVQSSRANSAYWFVLALSTGRHQHRNVFQDKSFSCMQTGDAAIAPGNEQP